MARQSGARSELASRAHRSSAAASARGVLPLLPALLVLVLVSCTGIPAAQAGAGAAWSAGNGQLGAGVKPAGRFGGAPLPATVPVSLSLRGGKDEEMAEAGEAEAVLDNSRFTKSGEQYPKGGSEKWPRAAEFKTIADKMRKAKKGDETAGPTVKELRTAMKPMLPSTYRDMLIIGKAREKETLMIANLIRKGKAPTVEEQDAEIEAMKTEAEGLEKLYRQGQGGYWLKYANGTISTHRLSFKDLLLQHKGDLKYLPKLLMIHDKTAQMLLAHVKNSHKILGWANSTEAAVSAKIHDSTFRQKQEDARAMQLFTNWELRYKMAMDGHLRMKKGFLRESVILRRAVNSHARGNVDTAEYLERKKQEMMGKAQKLREANLPWNEFMESQGVSALPKKMQGLDGGNVTKVPRHTQAPKKRAWHREGRVWQNTAKYNPTITATQKASIRNKLDRSKKKKFSHNRGATTAGFSGGATNNYMHPTKGWEPKQHFPSR